LVFQSLKKNKQNKTTTKSLAGKVFPNSAVCPWNDAAVVRSLKNQGCSIKIR